MTDRQPAGTRVSTQFGPGTILESWPANRGIPVLYQVAIDGSHVRHLYADKVGLAGAILRPLTEHNTL